MSGTVARKLALLDLDNSLRDGWVIADFADALVSSTSFPARHAHRLREILGRYGAGELGYEVMAQEVPTSFAEGLRGIAVDEVQQRAGEFLDNDPIGFRPFTPDLFSALRRRTIDCVIVSGAPQEILDAVILRYPITDAVGTTFDIQPGGIYTGRVRQNRASASSKREALESIVSDDVVVELALGDSDSDAPLFAAARVAVVVDNEELAGRTPNSVFLTADQGDISSVAVQLDQFSRKCT